MVDDFDASQPLGVINSFEAGDDQPHRETVLWTDRVHSLAVGDQTVVHGLRQRNASGSFNLLRSLLQRPNSRPSEHRPLSAKQTGARRYIHCNWSSRAFAGLSYGPAWHGSRG